MPRSKRRTGSSTWSMRPTRRLQPHEQHQFLALVAPAITKRRAVVTEIEKWLFAFHPGAVQARHSSPLIPKARGRPRRDELLKLIFELRSIFDRHRRHAAADYVRVRTRATGSRTPSLSAVERREAGFVSLALDIAGIAHIGGQRARDVSLRGQLLAISPDAHGNTVRRYFAQPGAAPPHVIRAMRIAPHLASGDASLGGAAPAQAVAGASNFAFPRAEVESIVSALVDQDALSPLLDDLDGFATHYHTQAAARDQLAHNVEQALSATTFIDKPVQRGSEVDDLQDWFVGEVGKAFVAATGRRATVNVDRISGQASGPFFDVLRSLLPEKPDAAIVKMIQRMDK